MKPYDKYSFEDFISDDTFVDWVLSPTNQQTAFWQQFLQAHPNKASLIEEAKDLILQLHEVETLTIPQEHFQKNWTQISNQTINKEAKITTIKVSKKPRWSYMIAASFALLLSALGVLFFQSTPTNAEQQLTTKPTMEWKELKNTTAIKQTIHLADGSVVILEPFSSLKYPSQFTKKQREVVLKGEAFFDIARDTTQPFVVYANETITKVLGTSFTIKAFEGEQEVEVAVKTGKVAVYANVNSLPKKIIKEKEKFVIRTDENLIIPIPNKKLEVTPNQRVVFNKVKADMQKSVAKLPLPIKPVKQLLKFRFYNEPVSEVLKALADVYELEINFDEKDLSNCLITTTLEEVSIFEKLNIICQAMNLTYQEQEAVIYIYGQCK